MIEDPEDRQMSESCCQTACEGVSEPENQSVDADLEESESASTIGASKTPLARLKNLPTTIGLKLIRFYQVAISANRPASCRFRPTCSAYTYTAIRRYGLIKGSWMGAKRIAKCHPFHPGGYDPVP